MTAHLLLLMLEDFALVPRIPVCDCNVSAFTLINEPMTMAMTACHASTIFVVVTNLINQLFVLVLVISR